MTSERSRVAAIGAGLFLLTVAVYWALGPKTTAYDYQLSQAVNILHGHLDLTEQYTRNLGILERVLYDGQGFCLPVDDPRGPQAAAQIEAPRFSADCRTYMQHALGPAFLLIPLVLLFGTGIDQTLVSILVAGLTAPLVFALARRFSDHLGTQLSLTVLVMFGSILWYVGANGGVWFFAHTTAVLFLFGAIYATLVLRNPLLAGALVGAAFMCRPTTILAGLFPLVAFADQWLAPAAPGLSTWRRIRLRPLVALAVGVLPFVAATMAVNELRFGNPFESGYQYGEQVHQVGLRDVYDHGLFDPSYMSRHVAVFWAGMPIFAAQGSFVWPSWAGLATWVTSPALLGGLFLRWQRSRPARLVAAAVGAAGTLMLIQAAATGLAGVAPWPALLSGLLVLPFWIAVAGAVTAATLARDRVALACWAAVIVAAAADWQFAATGWAQFGYRYALDFTPFLVVLVMLAVGRRSRWYHMALVAIGVVVNLWGVLWIYQAAPAELFGWTWVSF